jgi:hypothetical protein
VSLFDNTARPDADSLYGPFAAVNGAFTIGIGPSLGWMKVGKAETDGVGLGASVGLDISAVALIGAAVPFNSRTIDCKSCDR